MEENKSFLEKVQMGEKMWSDLHNEGSESLFTSWRYITLKNLKYSFVNLFLIRLECQKSLLFYYSSEVTPTGSKMSSIFCDQNHAVGTLTEGDDSGFCKSVTSMTSSASSLVMQRPSPKFPLKGIFQNNIIIIIIINCSGEKNFDF